jgi:hypothetical protein
MVELARKEFNYHTHSRGIDLGDKSTWHLIDQQHNWKQGWAKWLIISGAQVCFNFLPNHL